MSPAVDNNDRNGLDVEQSNSPAEATDNENVRSAAVTGNGDLNGHSNGDDRPSEDNDAAGSADDGERKGSTSSARFNILSTMVGGGCLSLPLAFQQSGNALIGPILLIVAALLADFCFRLLVESAKTLSGVDFNRRGNDSFESITSAAFGPSAFVFSKALVTAMCFFGAVGYAVLLRDMLEPINDSVQILKGWAWLHKNFSMFTVVLVVTPLCTLKSFTALKRCNATSMFSILILGTSIVIRSMQCNFGGDSNNSDALELMMGGDDGAAFAGSSSWYSQLHMFPDSPKDVLDAIPLFISCFVCHYNILPVHNELRDPSPVRVSWWLRTTAWSAFTLYIILGFSGSLYGHCTASGKVQGNVLLDFNKDDPLLLVGRMCLAVTITLAFPMLVIPARDIVMRSIAESGDQGSQNATTEPLIAATSLLEGQEALEEPLLQDNNNPFDAENLQLPASGADANADDDAAASLSKSSFLSRLGIAICIFWTAAAVASCVKSIDIVWDLLGSSLSILLSYLIPCGAYLRITKDDESGNHTASRILSWMIILVFTPLMFLSTGNAIQNTFAA